MLQKIRNEVINNKKKQAGSNKNEFESMYVLKISSVFNCNRIF